MNTPGSRLKAAREMKRLSLRDVEAQTEITPSHLSKIERDLVRPTVAVLRRLAPAYGLDDLDSVFGQLDDVLAPFVGSAERRSTRLPRRSASV